MVTSRPLQTAHAMPRSFRRLVSFCALATNDPRQVGKEVTREKILNLQNKKLFHFPMHYRDGQM